MCARVFVSVGVSRWLYAPKASVRAAEKSRRASCTDLVVNRTVAAYQLELRKRILCAGTEKLRLFSRSCRSACYVLTMC